MVWGRLSTEEHRAGTKESTGASANPHATQPVYLAVDITKIQKQGLSGYPYTSAHSDTSQQPKGGINPDVLWQVSG